MVTISTSNEATIATMTVTRMSTTRAVWVSVGDGEFSEKLGWIGVLGMVVVVLEGI